MNPIKNALKSTSITMMNVIVAFVFFVITAKISTPEFFGKVAILQLLEIIVAAFLFPIRGSIITRETAYLYAKKNIDKRIISSMLFYPLFSFPFLLAFLLFPTYIKFAIPYLFIYLLFNSASAVMLGLDLYTEYTIANYVITIFRWGLSIIAVLLNSIYLLIGIWTLGGLISTIISYLSIFRKIGGMQLFLDLKSIRIFIKESFPLYLSASSSFLSTQGDRVITAYLLGSYYLGIYQFAALVGGVPSMFLSNFNSVILPSSSYYKALGSNETKISALTFKVLSLISIFSAIISIPIAISVVYKFFPAYASGIQALIILLLALTLSVPFTSLSSIIVASKKDLRPFILIAVINGITVVPTSYFLIPKIGILGAAISQLIVNIMYSMEVIIYAIRSNVFNLSLKEIGVTLVTVFIGMFMFFMDSWFIDLILALSVIIIFRGLKIFTKDEIITIISFIPKNMKFLSKILFIFSS